MKKHATVVGIFDNHIALVDTIKDLRHNGFSDDQLGFVVRQNASSHLVVDGLLGTADALLLPTTSPSNTSSVLEAALPATEKTIDNLSHRGSHTLLPPTSPQTTNTALEQNEATQAHNSKPDTQESRGASIITGSVIGGTLGAVAAMLIPGIGPLLAGGFLATTFAGAAIGGIAGGFLNMGIPEQKAHYYEQQFHAGRIILTIKTNGRTQEALNILRHYGSREIEVY
jgi:hypothetical protein